MVHKIFVIISLVFFSFFGCNQKDSLYSHKLYPYQNKEEFEKKGHEFIVVTEGKYASEAGYNILARGGNVFDAAVAISFVLAVERPFGSGLGGGGFALTFRKGDQLPTAWDFREKAPLSSHQDMFLDPQTKKVVPGQSIEGPLSSGVPGQVHGLLSIHQLYGKLPLDQVMEKAITLANNGFPVSRDLANALNKRGSSLAKSPDSLKIFFGPNNRPLKEGDLLLQKDLAQVLITISEKGFDGFYKGWVAKAITDHQRQINGLITQNDLNQYKTIKRNPIKGSYKNYQVYSMSPPSSGGIHLIEMLNILENDPLENWGVQSPKTINLIAGAMQQIYADRAKFLGDTDFVTVPIEGLTSKKYALELRKKLSLTHSIKQEEVFPGHPIPYESNQTTHLVVMDKEGNVVTSTQTLNELMGNGIVIPGTGILLNNEMDDFTAKVAKQNIYGAIGGHNNLVMPEKRPLSSMSPTLVFKDGVPYLAIGAISGTRIISCSALTLLNYLTFNLSLWDSISITRYHQQWYPDQLRIDETSFPNEVIQKLEKMGHKIIHMPDNCRVQAIANKSGTLTGVSDPRGHGLVKAK